MSTSHVPALRPTSSEFLQAIRPFCLPGGGVLKLHVLAEQAKRDGRDEAVRRCRLLWSVGRVVVGAWPGCVLRLCGWISHSCLTDFGLSSDASRMMSDFKVTLVDDSPSDM